MYNSTIKRKKCKCGCHRYPTLGYSGYAAMCAPQEIKDKVGSKRDVARRNKNARNRTSNLLRKDSDADKTELLKIADKLFGDFIKLRDSNEQGVIICPCCGLPFSLKDKNPDGTPVVQTLHFVSRSVYSLRFLPENSAAGNDKCNLMMHLNPYGKEYVNYRKKLVNTIGEVKVAEMEGARRNINKLTVEYLKEIIEKYKPSTVENAKLK